MKEVTLLNLTPHSISVADEAGNIVKTIPSVGVFRVELRKRNVGFVQGVPVTKYESTPPTLPPMQDGLFYIVSTPAASAIKRPDYISPVCDWTAIRDQEGNVVAVRSFQTF